MRYLVSVELPEIMTISECADWIAFGRVPVRRPVPGQPDVDARRDAFSVKAARAPEVSARYAFDAAELDQLLPGVNYNEYRLKLAMCGGREPLPPLFGEVNEQDAQGLLALARSDEERELLSDYEAVYGLLQEAGLWFRDVKDQLDRHLSKARSAVAQALIDGRLTAVGFLTGDVPIDRPPEEWILQEIHMDDWNPEEIGWDGASLFRMNGCYVGITVSTSDVLALFPFPKLAGRPLSGQQFGAVVMVGAHEPPKKIPSSRKPRGASTKASKEQIAALRAAFHERLETGNCHASIKAEKNEAVLWMRTRFGLDLSPDTAGRYIQETLSQHMSRKKQKSGS